MLSLKTSLCPGVVETLLVEEDDVATSSYKQHVAGYFLKTELGGGVTQVVDVLKGYCESVQLPT